MKIIHGTILQIQEPQKLKVRLEKIIYQNQAELLKAIHRLEARVQQDQPLQQDLYQADPKEEKIDYF